MASSLGKGLTASSLGSLLKARGLRVTMQKLDPYLNVERLYRDTVFGAGSNDDASYGRAIGGVLAAAQATPFVFLQTTARDAARFERLVSEHRKHITVVPFDDDEVYVTAGAARS